MGSGSGSAINPFNSMWNHKKCCWDGRNIIYGDKKCLKVFLSVLERFGPTIHFLDQNQLRTVLILTLSLVNQWKPKPKSAQNQIWLLDLCFQPFPPFFIKCLRVFCIRQVWSDPMSINMSLLEKISVTLYFQVLLNYWSLKCLSKSRYLRSFKKKLIFWMRFESPTIYWHRVWFHLSNAKTMKTFHKKKDKKWLETQI